MTRHIEDLERQIRFRQDIEQQLEALIESSPAAIVTVDSGGLIERANQAAQQLLSPEGPALRGLSIAPFVPALQAVAQSFTSRALRTTVPCQGPRPHG